MFRSRLQGCWVCLLWGGLFCLPSFSQTLHYQPRILNVYQLPSTQRSVLMRGGGYFPVLSIVDQNLFAVFRTGAGHLGRGGALGYSRSSLDAQDWTPPQTIVNSPADDRNPAVMVLRDCTLVVAYHEQSSYTPGGKYDPALHKARCMVTRSEDGGKTWSPPSPVQIEGLESCSPYGRIIQTSDGTLLMNLYGAYTDKVPGMNNPSHTQRNYAYLVRSKDQGKTWQDPTLILAGHNETALLALNKNTLLAVSRDSTAMQRLDSTISFDGGRTWTSPIRLTNRMQHPAELLRLSNGWILLLYGDRGSQDKVIRGLISRDGARTWDLKYGLECSRPVQGDFGYPSAVRLPNGNIAIAYYWGGKAKDSYDGSQAMAFLVQFKEADLIDAYQQLLSQK